MTYTIQDFGPNDILSSEKAGKRRVKTAAYSSAEDSVINEKLFIVSGSASTLDTQYLAFNLTLYADSIINRIVVNGDYLVKVYDQHATGTPDGIFDCHNSNKLSLDDLSPSTGQLYLNATPVGDVICAGVGSHNSSVIAGFGNDVSIVVLNETGLTKNIDISVFFEEIGIRSASVGLTAITLLEPNTEMSNYG